MVRAHKLAHEDGVTHLHLLKATLKLVATAKQQFNFTQSMADRVRHTAKNELKKSNAHPPSPTTLSAQLAQYAAKLAKYAAKFMAKYAANAAKYSAKKRPF